ncbi:2-oxoadipate dioxygenase/decarboxylase HglS [Novosphingobium terrae]|uniref:2-oxoadipate dioxygenase/decarboxylase HglS n=1 Tax=Novosphingobium terrae TaxID=2726189 RepID=UPI001F135E08|nr:VOC family protein [Novosphingobium terrae]
MSAMYREEVPLYGDLIEIVRDANAEALGQQADLKAALSGAGELERLDVERHGAIRVGTAEELALLRRIFAVMGMHPVEYYDLSVAGVPVHSAAFRPIDPAALLANPFRVFTSLLRLDLIEDEDLRAQAAAILASRQIVSQRGIALLEQAEREGGLTPQDAESFVREVLDIFRWHGDARVSHETYRRLNAAHRLIADVVSFAGPHINHLTPRTLDIDAAHRAMAARGIDAKAVIEGPPTRKVPILLRQTSFKALEEPIRFTDQQGEAKGTHTARFGEIEQRGAALTPKGRALYDACLDEARADSGSQGADYVARLTSAFSRFPDDLDSLRQQGLAFFRYRVADSSTPIDPATSLERCIEEGRVLAEPVLYEDFLPVSAAGIFQSNLGGAEQASFAAHSSRQAFEAALGQKVLDPFALYAAIEQASIAAVETALGTSFAARGEA